MHGWHLGPGLNKGFLQRNGILSVVEATALQNAHSQLARGCSGPGCRESRERVLLDCRAIGVDIGGPGTSAGAGERRRRGYFGHFSQVRRGTASTRDLVLRMEVFIPVSERVALQAQEGEPGVS